MKKYILAISFILFAVSVLLWRQNRAIREENGRLRHNASVLGEELDTFRTALGQSVMQVGQLELTVKELRQHNDGLQERLEQMKLKLRRVESLSINAVNTSFSFTVPLENRIVLPSGQSARTFRWQDPWNTVDGTVTDDSVGCAVKHRDTLDQVIYRQPRKFLFLRWGTKAIKQVVSARDPNTTIVYSEYIVLKRER